MLHSHTRKCDGAERGSLESAPDGVARKNARKRVDRDDQDAAGKPPEGVRRVLRVPLWFGGGTLRRKSAVSGVGVRTRERVGGLCMRGTNHAENLRPSPASARSSSAMRSSSSSMVARETSASSSGLNKSAIARGCELSVRGRAVSLRPEAYSSIRSIRSRLLSTVLYKF